MEENVGLPIEIRDNLARHPGQRLGLLFRVDEPVPVIHFNFSYKKT